jgi:TonB family protein
VEQLRQCDLTQSFLASIAILSAALAVASCSALPPPSTGSSPVADSVPLDPKVTAQISADAQWLGKNKLPPAPAAPTDAATCPADQIRDRGKRQFQIPATLATILVSYNARPWAHVRYDIDASGTPANLRIETSAGLKSFDGAALTTVSAWRFDFTSGLSGAKNCIAVVSVT